jgi:hypothetical protein
MKKLNCSSCGAELRIEENKEYAVCDHCGSKYKLNEDLNINIKLDDNVKDVINTSFGTVNKASKFMFVPIFIFFIAFSLILFIGIRSINRSRNNSEENRKQTEEKVNKQQEEVKKDIFNFQFVNDNGTKSALLLESTLDEIIQSNKLYNRKVTLVYNGKETTDETEIINIKHSLEGDYEVSLDYDDEGFINRIKVDTIK